MSIQARLGGQNPYFFFINHMKHLAEKTVKLPARK